MYFIKLKVVPAVFAVVLGVLFGFSPVAVAQVVTGDVVTVQPAPKRFLRARVD